MSSKGTRTRRPSMKKKAASPSLTSLFSSVTKSSVSSSGSTSTVTPKGTAQRQSNPPLGPSSKRTGSTSKGSPLAATTDPPPEAPEPPRPNVFAFMDNTAEMSEEESDGGSEDGPPDLYGARAALVRMHSSPPVTPELAKASRRASTSLHSDSGISVRSETPDLDKTPRALSHMHSQASPADWRAARDHGPLSHAGAGDHPLPPQYSPRGYMPPAHGRGHPAGFPPHRAPHLEPAPALTDSRLKHLARHLSTAAPAKPRPIYRRFEHLTNQLLLQLQSDLSSIESELAALDSPRPRPRPAPDRDARWRRSHLVAAAGARLDAYHRLLAAYDTLARLPRAAADDADAHRRFLHLPDAVAAGAEWAYLERLEDAVRVGCGGAEGGSAAVGAAALVVVVLVRAVPGVMARAVLGGVVLGGGVAGGWLPTFGRGDWRVDAGVYGAAALVLAVAVA